MFTISDQMLQYPARPLPLVMETTRWKPNNVELAPNCPRCASSNTKFCYYNNYSLSQPRYFCKGCRRYWTKGGSLRNVPVGGGCRKSRRSKSFRPPRTERSVSTTTYSGDIDIINTGNSAHTPNDPFSINEDPSSKINGQDIDLAVVFAKFLNQNSSHDDEIVGHELAGEADLLQNSAISVDESDIIGLEQGLIEGHRPSDFVTECQLIDVYAEDQEKRQEEEEKIRQKNNVYSMEGLFSNENDQVLVENAIWSDAETMPNFMVQLQELETTFMASSNEQLKMSANLISDSWSSLDLPSYEVFSGP